MSRGPLPWQAIKAAIVIARARGVVTLCQRNRESVCDIVVHAKGVTIDAMIQRCRRLHAPIAEIEMQFADVIARLRLVPEDPCRSRELWVCSPYGVFRFFRLRGMGLVELTPSGEVVPA